mgnify:CR=1 FL=1
MIVNLHVVDDVSNCLIDMFNSMNIVYNCDGTVTGVLQFSYMMSSKMTLIGLGK